MNTKRKSKKKKVIVASIIIIAIVGIVGSIVMKPAKTSYDSVDAKTGDITDYYSFTGNVETKNRQTVSAEKVTQISTINVKDGDIVEADAVLFTTTTGEEIKSKIAGEIVNMNIEENSQVMGGSKLLEIVDYNNLEIQVKVDEYDIASLAEGKETTVKIGAINKEIKGTISKMSKEGQIVNGVTFFTATIELEKDDSVKIGMSAEAKIISASITGAVTLPMTAIQFDDNNNPYVLKSGEKNAALKAEITTGINVSRSSGNGNSTSGGE